MRHVPRQAGPGEAQVRVHSVGISRSDRDVYLGRRPVPYVRYPVTPGHEWSGTVTAAGEGAPASLLGRKVVGTRFVRRWRGGPGAWGGSVGWGPAR